MLTGPLERVLRAFLADLSEPQYGYGLMRAAKLPSGTLYPMLARLEDEGLVTSEWEPRADDHGGRPPRKLYRLTGEGARVARAELAEVDLRASRESARTRQRRMAPQHPAPPRPAPRSAQ
jgi:DNA-binding PadR family transcriptional regulator